MDRLEKEGGCNFITVSLFSFVLVGVLKLAWPTIIPFGFWDMWTSKGPFWTSLLSVWPLFVWAIGLTVVGFMFGNRPSGYDIASDLLIKGVASGAFAGVFEEISYRWLLFYLSLIVVPVLDWLFLGFAGLHIVHWMYMSVLCPIADFFTLGYLHQYLGGSMGWIVAAGIISTNTDFRDGHKYLGTIGYINSWFGGMFLFWIVFNHGLLVAIAAHFLYNFLVNATAACAVVLGIND